MILDENFLEELYFSYSQRLVNYANSFLNDRQSANDVVQDSFIKFWEKYGGKSSVLFPSLLFSIVRNKCLDIIRHKALESKFLIYMGKNENDEIHESALYANDFRDSSESDYRAIFHELKTEVESTLSSFPERTRQIFVMSRIDGMKNKEIAGQLGVGEKAVEKQITKALSIFRRKLLFNNKF